MNERKLLYATLAICIISLAISLKNFLDLKSLYCDLSESVMAEREYTYPILRKIEDPMNYGPGSNDTRTKNLKNPLTTSSKYLDHCK
jgi:hypothetical protein